MVKPLSTCSPLLLLMYIPGSPWGAPVFLYGLIYFSMAFLNIGYV